MSFGINGEVYPYSDDEVEQSTSYIGSASEPDSDPIAIQELHMDDPVVYSDNEGDVEGHWENAVEPESDDEYNSTNMNDETLFFFDNVVPDRDFNKNAQD